MPRVRILVSGQESSRQAHPNLWKSQLPVRARDAQETKKGIRKKEVRIQDNPGWWALNAPTGEVMPETQASLLTVFRPAPLSHASVPLYVLCLQHEMLFPVPPPCLANSLSFFTFPREPASVLHPRGATPLSVLQNPLLCSHWGPSFPCFWLPSPSRQWDP